MKKFLYKSILFTTIFIILYGLFIHSTNSLLINQYGPTTEQQITKSFDDVLKDKHDLIFLGNSRIYRGLNPDFFNIKAYNFAHDNDSFNQSYYKLLYLKNNNKLPKYIVLGVDYFEFSFLANERNTIYQKYFSENYMNDYSLSNKFNIRHKLKTEQNQLNVRGMCLIKKILNEKNNSIPTLKDNGQYIKYSKASSNDKVTRESNILDIQLNYFNEILNFCHKENIYVFLIMPPTRQKELNNYNKQTIDSFNKLFNSKSNSKVYYWNFSQEKSFSLNDFQDITHLNIEGADKFSILLNKQITNTLNSSTKNSPDNLCKKGK